jgi:hypothetical protein
MSNLSPFIQSLIRPTNTNVEQSLYNDYKNTKDEEYKNALSTVLTYKISSLTQMLTYQNLNVINYLSTIKPQ